ncbi:uncharacterized protein (DUF58 family) [Pullulanibacillus pueri]|uniref:DUF58 domain-containing protein n=1 Tax=Pullulanibacillus pueri TaxID=1437324 RepID=A0A8J2ZUE1_9BACL|nr:DUF58 domain-containing protein [Pullulanibacillus pueri]MBM7681120.1 uncharacterized protein (DUF58 family) [Pullulanibacillus pueri]GGH77125.1 hypothetical protein GCM10007096_08560 [Pullulanibacillus pueri]
MIRPRPKPLAYKTDDALIVVGILLLFFSLFIHFLFLMLPGTFLLLLGLYPRLYLKYVSRHFDFLNERERVRLLQGEEDSFHLTFENKGKLPLYRFNVRFELDHSVTMTSIDPLRKNRYQFDLSLGKARAEAFQFEIKGLSRGVAKLKRFEVRLFDPLKIASVTRSFEFINKQMVVYPKSEPIAGLEKISLPIEGELPHQASLYHDFTSPVGTRDYLMTDPLKNVHWKASARTGQLQTKLFESAMGMHWTVLILMDRHLKKGVQEQLEKDLEYITALCLMAQKRGIAFEILVNFKPMGREEVMHVHLGLDRSHLVKALEFLAYLNVKHVKTNPLAVLRKIDRNASVSRVVFIIDHSDLDIQALSYFYQKWIRQGHQVYTLNTAGVLNPVHRGGESYVHKNSAY